MLSRRSPTDAHSKHMSQVEADTYRQMAMYQPDPKQALVLLSQAEAALKEGKNSMQAAIHQEQAQILRVRVESCAQNRQPSDRPHSSGSAGGDVR